MLRLPSGALLSMGHIRGVHNGRASPVLGLTGKASTVRQGHRKLSVRGSAKNAKDHYNGGRGPGGFQRFV